MDRDPTLRLLDDLCHRANFLRPQSIFHLLNPARIALKQGDAALALRLLQRGREPLAALPAEGPMLAALDQVLRDVEKRPPGEDLTTWRVARKPRQGADYRLIYQGDEARARKMYDAIDLRQGAVRLLAPGQPLSTAAVAYTAGQSGPNLMSRW